MELINIEKSLKQLIVIKRNGRKIKIETIQDIIVNKLKSLKYIEVYESFIQYRENRKKIRDAFEERKQYKFLGILDKLKIEENITIKEKKEGITPKSKIEKLRK